MLGYSLALGGEYKARCMRWRLGVALLTLLCALPAAAETVLLVDSPFSQGPVVQPTRIYDLDPATGALTLKADLGATYTAVLALAAASGTTFYAVGGDNEENVDCFGCLLLRIDISPPSTTPSITVIGHVLAGGSVVTGFTQLAFRGNGDLYGVSEETDGLYLIDLETANAMEIGHLTVDSGGGCTTTPIDIIGGDLAFDGLDRLWLWNNATGAKGLWEVNPANGCATLRSSCPNSRNMSGLTVADHTSSSPMFRAPTPNDDRLYRVFSGACPVNGESTSVVMRLNGVVLDHNRGDSDSPYCVSNAACADTDACTVDLCSPGGCVHDPLSCDDGSACTDDTCNSQSGCQYTPHACDDGNACTGDSCDPATGCLTAPVSCDDGDPCTDDSCDSQSGCQHTPHVCNDGNACTADSCDPATGCQTSPISCDDGDACTDDSCDPQTGCQHTPHVCDDGNACTADSCDPATGCQTAPVSCDDGNACTDDSCDPQTGCQHTTHVCDDSNACTVDSCDPTTGCQTTPVVCDDGNVCTSDACDPSTGCTFVAVSGACDDGDPCTENDACSAGTCSGSPVAVLEVPSLSVTRHAQGTKIAWAPPPGPAFTYALVSGPIAELGGEDAIPTATCIGDGLGLSTYDLRADPLPGAGFYYDVRAESTCGGRGPYGRTSGGSPRLPHNDCP